jgi:hypothetical protein
MMQPAYHEELNPLKASMGSGGKPLVRLSPPPFHVGFIPQTYVNAAVAAVDASGAPQVVSGRQGKPSYQALQMIDLTPSRSRLGSIQSLQVLGAFGTEQDGVLSWTIVGVQADSTDAEAYRQEVDTLGVMPDISLVSDPVLRQTLSNAAFWLASSSFSGATQMLNEGRMLPPSAAENLISVFHTAWAHLVFSPSDDRSMFGFDVLQKAFPGPWVPEQGWQPPSSSYATQEQAAVYSAAALPMPDAAAYFAAGGSKQSHQLSQVTDKPVFEAAAATASFVQRSIGGAEGIMHAGVVPEEAAIGQAAAASADAKLHAVKLPGFLQSAAEEGDPPQPASSEKVVLHEFNAEQSEVGLAYLADEDVAATHQETAAWEAFKTLDPASATWEEALAAFDGDAEIAHLWRATHQAHMISEHGVQESAASMPSVAAAASAAESKRAARQAGNKR